MKMKALLLLGVLALGVHAKVIWINSATTGPNSGNDANSGLSKDVPLNNLATPFTNTTGTQVASGDTIVLFPGTYIAGYSGISIEKSVAILSLFRYENPTAPIDTNEINKYLVQNRSGTASPIFSMAAIGTLSNLVLDGFAMSCPPYSGGSSQSMIQSSSVDTQGKNLFLKNMNIVDTTTTYSTLYNGKATVTASNCIFKQPKNNTMIFMFHRGANSFTDCIFQDNNAALFYGNTSYTQKFTLKRCQFRNNRTQNGNGLSVIASNFDEISIDSCSFQENGAQDTTRALFGAIPSLTITNSQFSNNRVMMFRNNSVTLTNCDLWNNSGTFAANTKVKSDNCAISDSSIAPWGTQIFFNGVTYRYLLDKNTIHKGLYEAFTTCAIQNSILEQPMSLSEMFTSISNSLLHKDGATNYIGNANTLTNNIYGMDPYFVDPANGDFHLKGTFSPASGTAQDGSEMGRYFKSAGMTTTTTKAQLVYLNESIRTKIGERKKGILKIANIGSDPARLLSFTGQKALPSNLVIDSMSIDSFTMLNAGDTAKLYYSWSPSQTVPLSTETWSFPYKTATSTEFGSITIENSGIVDEIFANEWDIGQVPAEEAVACTVSLKNNGFNPITIDSAKVSPEYLSKITNISGSVVQPGDSLKLGLVFTPKPLVSHNYTYPITLYSKQFDGESDATLIFKAHAIIQTLTPSTSSLDFGSVQVDSTGAKAFEISNTNAFDVHLDSVTFSDPAYSMNPILKDTTISGTDGAKKVSTTINFKPTVTGTIPATMTIHFAGKKKTVVSLSGISVKSDVTTVQSKLDFGRIPLYDGLKDMTVKIANNGTAPITLGSTNLTATLFSVSGKTEGVINPKDTGFVTIRFISSMSGKGGYYEGTATISYNDPTGTKQLPTVEFSGSCVGAPTAMIDSISPATSVWDTAKVVTFTGKGSDSDIADSAKTGKDIAAYLWQSSLNGTLANTTASFNLKSSDLKIGTHTITLRVIDNEGDTSAAVSKTITINGQTPFAKIDTIAPRSVILRDGAMVKLKLTAHDRDEPATNDAVKVQWYSTLKGILTGVTGKIDSIAPSSLELGLHGFYAIVTDNEGQVTNSDTINIPVQNSMGHAIIVTGATFGETSYFMNNIAPNANMAYKRLKNRGFSDEQIFYMNPVSWQSIDGNGLTDSKIVDQTAMTKENLHAYLTSIAGDIKKDIPLVIYFLGHGNANQQNAKFYINDNEYIDPATLNSWLNEFGDLSANKSYITIILDFCYSGGFVPGLTSTTQKRAVITSASAGTTAYFSRGKSFGTALFNEVYRGKSLKSCFETASLWSEQNAPGGAKAKPIMNIDLATADNIFLGGSQNLQSIFAEIDSVSSSINLGNVAMTAKCTGKVSSIRCRMVPESFDPKTGSYADLPVTTFTRSGEDTTLWSGIVTYFPAIGNYLLMVEGEDEGANMILPQGIAVKIDNTGIKTMNKPAQLFFGTANIGGSTQLKFGLPESSPVTITIYDLRGRVVNQLVNSVLNAGYYNIPLDNLMGAGMYITRFTAGSKSMTEKVMIQR